LPSSFSSSVEASEDILIHSELGKCFSFFTDLTNIGRCIPGCEEVRALEQNRAIFRVKVKVGYISKMFEMRAKLKEIRANEHVSFGAEGTDAEINGEVDFLPAENNQVKISYTITIKPLSLTGRTAVSMLGKDLVKKQASEFASCVKQRLE
jgi:carbon monoxide dehydrogenase subunit G